MRTSRDAVIRFWGPLLGAGSALVIGATSPGCGDSEGSEFGTTCEAAYGDACGQACAEASDCAAGLYCATDGTCTADCVNGFDCGFGQSCAADGHCTPGGTGGASTSGTESTGTACPDVNVTFDKVIPTVLLLVDQSGSMTEPFGSSDRWQTLHDALVDPTTGIIKLLENDVRFGLSLYTSVNGFQGGTCPMMTNVSIAHGGYASIKATLDSAQPVEDTPTGESIDEAVKILLPITEPGPKVILLATDGEPDTCDVPDPQPTPEAQAKTVSATVAAYGQDIQTYIISVGNETGQMLLQEVANAGVGLPTDGSQGNAPYYQANDQQQLYDAFETIINGVRSCVFTLNGMVDPNQAGSGSVVLDGNPLGYNDPNGWKLNSPTEIELTGTACDAIQEGQHTLDVSFPCGVVEVPK